MTATTSARVWSAHRELGADVVIDYTAGPWAAGIEPVDLVFDTAGGERLARSPGVVHEGGRSSRWPRSRRRRAVSPACTSSSSRPPAAHGDRARCSTAAGRARRSTPCSRSRGPPSVLERSMASDKRGKVVIEVAR